MHRLRRNMGAVVCLCALAGCGSKSTPEPSAPNNMKLFSTAFQDGGSIPDKYTSYGQNISPGLRWSGAPSGTQSYVILVEDPDAPGSEPFVHWLVYNIAVAAPEFREGEPPADGYVGLNSAGTDAYYGPKPPSGTHHYHFEIFAVDESLSLGEGATKDQVMGAIKGHVIGKGELVGTYSR